MELKSRYKELRLGQMRAFCAVIRHRSFSAGARSLGVSHPAVWQQVRALERDFGAALVERKGRDILPTEDGETLLELAGEIVAAMDSVRQAFDDRRADKGCRLVVAGLTTVFVQDMAGLVAEFCRANPRVRLTLRTYHHHEVEELVAEGEAHTAVLSYSSPAAAGPRLVAEVVHRRDWWLSVPTRHPLARKARIDPDDLARHPLVLPDPGSSWGGQMADAFRGAGLTGRVQVALEVDSPLAALRFASLGLGPTVIPFSSRGIIPPGLVQKPLDHLFPPQYLVALWRKGAKPRPQARAFIDFAREHLAGG